MTWRQTMALRLRFQWWAPLRLNRHSSFYASHSQFGEDMAVRPLLEDCSPGFYVDAGAHHPVYYSNTYHFYRRGWQGINIEALPGALRPFQILRPRDINVQAALAARSGEELNFYVFAQAALNTCNVQAAEQARSRGEKLLRTIPLQSRTLAEILDQHLPPGRRIDLLSIDIEGQDEEILLSHDWRRYPARVVIFEASEQKLETAPDLPVVRHLQGLGYRLAAATGPSLIMARR